MAFYRFGPRFDLFEFDSATGEVVKDGRCVRLRPQPARVLAHLLERHGELVRREELSAPSGRKVRSFTSTTD